MKTIQQAFERVVQGLPKQILSSLLREKLEAQDLKLSPGELESLAEEILHGGKDTFLLKREDSEGDRKITLDFKSEDIERIERKFADFERRFPEAAESAIKDGSQKVFATLKQKWPAESQLQRQDIAGFRERLYERWRLPLERLRMLLTICREFGGGINQNVRQSADTTTKYLVEVLTRSHARACQITEEILCLLEGGFADGAMARWRTLHEVAVVTSFIANHGEGIAERYVLHQVVEANRAAAEYQKCHARLGFEPIEEDELRTLKVQRDAVIKRFGAPFKEQYGWAADALKNPQPNFAEIERAVGNGHLRAHYRMATHNVHANPKGVFFKLGVIGDSNVLLSGPSNAGLADPGDRTAWSLAHISATVATLEPSLDNGLVLQVIVQLMDEIGELFAEAQRRLEEEILRSERS